ncbi:MAG TPA: PhoU domain-containing protein [Pseudonocardiaceae bacterium]|nr:PhoU domain-containing protein [Pseudonocardiaceae bacterium]
MRRAFSAELDELIGDVARLARRTGQMMTDASTALWHPDLRLAESIISGDSEITTALCDDIGHRCVRLLALQAPVATDLRLVVAALHAVSDVLRMGKLAKHIAKITQLKHPVVPLPDDLEPVFTRMALLATTLAHDAARAIDNQNPRCAEQLVGIGQEVATLHRQILQRLFAQDWSHGVEPAVDAALLARYYTRFADHAIAIARQASYIATGIPPQR